MNQIKITKPWLASLFWIILMVSHTHTCIHTHAHTYAYMHIIITSVGSWTVPFNELYIFSVLNNLSPYDHSWNILCRFIVAQLEVKQFPSMNYIFFLFWITFPPMIHSWNILYRFIVAQFVCVIWFIKNNNFVYLPILFRCCDNHEKVIISLILIIVFSLY